MGSGDRGKGDDFRVEYCVDTWWRWASGAGQAESQALVPIALFSFPPLQLFNDAIRLAVSYKQNSRDFMDEVLQELEVGLAHMSGGIEKTASLHKGAELTQ